MSVIEESGEAMFERMCSALGLEAKRIPESAAQRQKSPDFEVVGLDGTAFHAEVKTVSPSPEEAEYIQAVYRGEVRVSGGTPGDRMRELIAKANKQLKAVADHGWPGTLVVFNPELLLKWHTEAYSILTAMRGLDVVDVTVPLDPGVPPSFGPLRAGPRKRMTADANTTTAAIVCPREISSGNWEVDVYHNRHAARVLPFAALDHLCVRQWVLTADHEFVKAPGR